MHRFAHQDPAHVRPPFAVDWRVRIAFAIGELMMNPVRRYPENRAAFERQSRANRQKVLHPFRSLVSAVRQQPVITHANAEAPGNPPQEKCDE